MLNACTELFRGAGYTAFDGELPANTRHAALATDYAHVTAPLRRLVDRFAGEVCLALSAEQDVPDWVRSALPALPELMASAESRSKKYERAVIDLVEVSLLHDRVGSEFVGTVIDVESDGKRGVVMIADPAVQARVRGTDLPLGHRGPAAPGVRRLVDRQGRVRAGLSASSAGEFRSGVTRCRRSCHNGVTIRSTLGLIRAAQTRGSSQREPTVGCRGGALRCRDVSRWTGLVARPIVVARCAPTSTASSPAGWPRIPIPATRRWTACDGLGEVPDPVCEPTVACPSPSRSPSTFRAPTGPGARWGDEPACKPDSVPGPEPGWRSSICDDRCRPPGAIYPEARASSPRTLPRVPGGTLLDLAPGGVCLATPVTRGAGGLLHHRFTLTPTPLREPGRSVLCGTVPRVAPGGCYPPPCSVESGLSSMPRGTATARPTRPRDSVPVISHRGAAVVGRARAPDEAWERSHENRQPWRCRPGLRRAAV